MLSGDHQRTVDFIARQVGIDVARGDLLPDDKVAAVQAQREKIGVVGMVGDGANDVPALAAASLGIAMGAAGTDAGIGTVDIALMPDELGRIAETVRLGRRTLGLIHSNIAFALGLKAGFFGLTLLGHASLGFAILADTGATLLAIANALRLLAPPKAPRPDGVRAGLARQSAQGWRAPAGGGPEGRPFDFRAPSKLRSGRAPFPPAATARLQEDDRQATGRRSKRTPPACGTVD